MSSQAQIPSSIFGRLHCSILPLFQKNETILCWNDFPQPNKCFLIFPSEPATQNSLFSKVILRFKSHKKLRTIYSMYMFYFLLNKTTMLDSRNHPNPSFVRNCRTFPPWKNLRDTDLDPGGWAFEASEKKGFVGRNVAMKSDQIQHVYICIYSIPGSSKWPRFVP